MRISPEAVGNLLRTLRAKRPLVHNITNTVVMDISANVLLALGASPAMVMAPEEVEEFAAKADALVTNIGTLSTSSLTAMRLAAIVMQHEGKPWVLDPVACGATAFRLAAAKGLLALRPTVIRGNAGEIASLAGATGEVGKGVDTLLSADLAVADAVTLARHSGTVVAITGEVDYVTDGDRTVAIHGGHPMMPLVTGLGCALSATTAAFLALGARPFEGAVAAIATFAVVGRQAGEGAAGPASLRQRFIDGLYNLTPADLAEAAEIEEL